MTGTDVSHPWHATRHGDMDTIGHSMKKGMDERRENCAQMIVSMRGWEVLKHGRYEHRSVLPELDA